MHYVFSEWCFVQKKKKKQEKEFYFKGIFDYSVPKTLSSSVKGVVWYCSLEGFQASLLHILHAHVGYSKEHKEIPGVMLNLSLGNVLGFKVLSGNKH